MTNLTRLTCMKWPFEMIVYWNVEMTICWGDEMIICWNVENVLWCWFTVSIFETFRWDCICCVRYEGDFDWNADDWCIFLRKLDQMNVYESRSTVLRWRKKKSFKWMWCCYRAMDRQAVDLMSEMLHLILISSDALARLSDCQNCIWCRCHQMHWRLSRCQTVALNLKAIRWETVDAQIAAFDRDEIKCTDEFLLMSELLHLMLKSSNALTKLSDCQTAALDRETVRCTLATVCCESPLQSADCNVIRDEVEEAKVRWSNVFRDETSKVALDAKIVECTDDFVCFLACYRAVGRASCWFNVRWLSLMLMHQMHWRSCLWSKLLHSMLKSSNALTKLSDFRKIDDSTIVWCHAAASDCDTVRCSLAIVFCESSLQSNATSFAMISRFCIRCWDRRMHWRFCLFFEELRTQRWSDNADKASDACWNCRLADWLIDWLQDKFLIWWRRLNVRCSLSLIANDFFRSQTISSSPFLTFFELWTPYFADSTIFHVERRCCLVCDDTSTFELMFRKKTAIWLFHRNERHSLIYA